LANIDKLPDLPQQNQSQQPEDSSDIPNADAPKSDSDAAPQPQANASIDGETVASSQTDNTTTDAQ